MIHVSGLLLGPRDLNHVKIGAPQMPQKHVSINTVRHSHPLGPPQSHKAGAATGLSHILNTGQFNCILNELMKVDFDKSIEGQL